MSRAQALGFSGFGGNCAQAAIAINDAVLDGRGQLVGAFNELIYDTLQLAIGHVAVRIGHNGPFLDGDGRFKDYDDFAAGGMLDSEDPSYTEPLAAAGVQIGPNGLYDVRCFLFENAEALRNHVPFVYDDLEQMTAIVSAARSSLSEHELALLRELQRSVDTHKSHTSSPLTLTRAPIIRQRTFPVRKGRTSTMMSTPRIIRAAVGPKVLSHAADFFNHSATTIFSELIQNARRAGATRVDITVMAQNDVGGAFVAFNDNGQGIADPADLLRFGGSGWNNDIERIEQPAGMGFFSLATRGVQVASNDWAIDISPRAFRGDEDVLVDPAPYRAGTAVRFSSNMTGSQIEAAIKTESRYAPIDVTLNGATLPREDFLAESTASVVAHGVRIGIIELHDRYSVRTRPILEVNFFGHVVDSKAKLRVPGTRPVVAR